MNDIRKSVEKSLEDGNGILRLRPAWITRDFMPPGKRLGLKDEDYEAGDRGHICERWFASVTHAENRINVEDEGYSYIEIEDPLLNSEMPIYPSVSLIVSSFLKISFKKEYNLSTSNLSF